MSIHRTVRGPYICYRPLGEINAAFLVEFKNALNADLLEGKKSIAIDMRKTKRIEGTGFKFFTNLGITLARVKKQLAFIEPSAELAEELMAQDKGWEIYNTFFDFERSFHEMPPLLRKNFFNLANGSGQIRSLELICPICGGERIRGYVDLHSDYNLEWVDNSITPELVYMPDPDGALDPERYIVSVCQECFYAADRIDWFDVRVGHSVMESHLSEIQIDRIANKVSNRKAVLNEYPALENANFFSIPREGKAAYVAWLLNEMTYRDIGKDKSHIDAFQMAYSHFMMCKFVEDNDKIEHHLSTALAWLNGMISHRDHYASYRVLQAKVYALSIYLFLGKFGDALKVERDIMREWGKDSNSSFWVDRARELIDEERAEMENIR